MGQVQYDNSILDFDDTFSRQDFTEKETVAIPNDTVVYQSCFSKETPDSQVFPPDMTGVSFYFCNLDNCVIPAGNTVVECTTRRFQVQEDGNDWLVDETNTPIEPVITEQPVEVILSTDTDALATIETPQTVTLNGNVVGQWVFIKQ